MKNIEVNQIIQPMLASDGNNVAIAWYTAPNGQPMVNLAFSNDEGFSFESPIRLDMSKPIGRVDLTWISPYEVMASWIESSEQTTNIVASIFLGLTTGNTFKLYLFAKSKSR